MAQGKQQGNLAEDKKINRKESQYMGKQKYNGWLFMESLIRNKNEDVMVIKLKVLFVFYHVHF